MSLSIVPLVGKEPPRWTGMACFTPQFKMPNGDCVLRTEAEGNTFEETLAKLLESETVKECVRVMGEQAKPK